MQADLSLRWAHMSEGTFSHAEAHLFFFHIMHGHVCHTCTQYDIENEKKGPHVMCEQQRF